MFPPLSLQEYQSCNTLPCPDLKKTTPWTPWTPVNISDNGGHYEQRFRYTCKARIPDPSLLEVGRQRIEMRYCSSDGSTGCSTDGECGIRGDRWSLSSHLSLLFPLLSCSNCLSVTLQANSNQSFCMCLCCLSGLPFLSCFLKLFSPLHPVKVNLF